MGSYRLNIYLVQVEWLIHKSRYSNFQVRYSKETEKKEKYQAKKK